MLFGIWRNRLATGWRWNGSSNTKTVAERSICSARRLRTLCASWKRQALQCWTFAAAQANGIPVKSPGGKNTFTLRRGSLVNDKSWIVCPVFRDHWWKIATDSTAHRQTLLRKILTSSQLIANQLGTDCKSSGSGLSKRSNRCSCP